MSRDDPSSMQLKKRHVPSSSSSPDDTDSLFAAAGEAPGLNTPHAPFHQQQQERALDMDIGPRTPHRYQADACSRRVLLPSSTARKALLAGPLVIWVLSTGMGMLQFRGLPSKGQGTEHLMDWFDDLFRVAGPLLPLIPLLLRWAAMDGPACMRALSRRPRPAAPAAQATMPWACLAAYFAISAARVVLYLGHRAMQQQQQRLEHWGDDGSGVAEGNGSGAGVGGDWEAGELVPASRLGGWVSDHVFLAASVLACLQLELVCSLSDVVKLEVEGAGMLREFCAASALLLTACLSVFICMDMYFTCRYFHFPLESGAGLLAGAAFFQGPVLALLCYKRLRQC